MVASVLQENRPDDRDIGLASHGHVGDNGEVDMLNSFKGKAAEQDKSVAADIIEQAERSVVEQAAPRPVRTSNAMVRRRCLAESKASCAPRIF
jgi:hypothetical protein